MSQKIQVALVQHSSVLDKSGTKVNIDKFMNLM